MLFTPGFRSSSSPIVFSLSPFFFIFPKQNSYASKDNLVGRGYLYLADGALGKAERNFKYVLASVAPNDIPALLGNACLQFNQGKFAEALDTYRKVLRLHPKCPASVRVGIGMCFARMKVPDKAREAFTRALELDPENATALVGSAVLHSNEKTPDAMKRSLRTLKKAYDADNRNPLTLNQLSEHFFRKKEYAKTLTLAKNALKHTDIDAIKSESHYHIARVLHAKGSLDEAFRHYYQATKLYSSFPLPLYGLGQIYLHKNKRVEAIECFEKVLKAVGDDTSTKTLQPQHCNHNQHGSMSEGALENADGGCEALHLATLSGTLQVLVFYARAQC